MQQCPLVPVFHPKHSQSVLSKNYTTSFGIIIFHSCYCSCSPIICKQEVVAMGTQRKGDYGEPSENEEESFYSEDVSYYEGEEYSVDSKGQALENEEEEYVEQEEGSFYEEDDESCSQESSTGEPSIDDEGDGDASYDDSEEYSDRNSASASYEEESGGSGGGGTSCDEEGSDHEIPYEEESSETESVDDPARDPENLYGYNMDEVFPEKEKGSSLFSDEFEGPSFAVDSQANVFPSSQHENLKSSRHSEYDSEPSKSFAEDGDFADGSALMHGQLGQTDEAFDDFGDEGTMDDSLQFEDLVRDPLGLQENSKNSSVTSSRSKSKSSVSKQASKAAKTTTTGPDLTSSFMSAEDKTLTQIDEKSPSSGEESSSSKSFPESDSSPRGPKRANQSRDSFESFLEGTPDSKLELRNTGYTRDQMTDLRRTVSLENLDNESIGSSVVSSRTDGTSRTLRRKQKKRLKMMSKKSEGLLQLNADVSEVMEKIGEVDEAELDDSSPIRLILGFEGLVSILLHYSDELELLNTFKRKKDDFAKLAFQNLINFAAPLDDLFMSLRPALLHYVDKEQTEELNDCLFGMNETIELIGEMAFRIGEKRDWNPRSCASFVTLIELLARDGIEVESIYHDEDTPEYMISEDIENSWLELGLEEELKALAATQDLELFRSLCYEVILSTDQWCPHLFSLQDICGVSSELIEFGQKPDPEEDLLAPTPDTALHILEKINGDPVPRSTEFMSILRRVIPSYAVTDPNVQEDFASIRSSVLDTLDLPQATMVAITSVPEHVHDPSSKLGLAGVGKSTLAAMIADHEDVRRFYGDGIAWLHIGREELTYCRYVDCLLDIIAQFDLSGDNEPIFPDLLHIPGETPTKRKRREEGFMIHARDMMAEFVEGLRILIILDDVYFEKDYDWFDFAIDEEEEEDQETETFCMLLMTTRNRHILPPVDKVEIDILREEEAANLLQLESGPLASYLSNESEEVHSMVTECAYHPLAVKSVGRWLTLKHAFSGIVSSADAIHADIVKSVNKLLRGNQENADLMYQILDMSLTPTVNEKPTTVVKLCLAAFVKVFYERKYMSDAVLLDSMPGVPLGMTVCLFENILELEEEHLKESLFHTQNNETARLIADVLSALGILKIVVTSVEEMEDGDKKDGNNQPTELRHVQLMHSIQEEYAEHLLNEDSQLVELTKDAEVKWNRALVEGYSHEKVTWDSDNPDENLDYALEMLPIHMIRAEMFAEAANLLTDESFANGRLLLFGRDVATRRYIQDCEYLFTAFLDHRVKGRTRKDAKLFLKKAYKTFGDLLPMGEEEYIKEEGSQEAVEVARSHYQLGFSLAERQCWEDALYHWDISQDLFASALGIIESVAAILFSSGVVYTEMSEYEKALESLQQCLRIRGAIHGEEHILYAQTIQKIGDVFLAMSDYNEAMESYEWALDVMHVEPRNHRIDIGDILEQMGRILYSKGEIENSLQCFQDCLRSKKVDLGENHPELSSAYNHIGNCLSDLGKAEDAVAHFKEAIRLKELDIFAGNEKEADILTIKGSLHNLHGNPKKGLECYEMALQIVVTKIPHRKEKVASILYMIGCVYLMSGEHKKALKLFQESLHARRKVLGFVHLDVASTLFNMAFLYQTRNRPDKALKCLEECLKIRQLRLPDSEKVAVTQMKIGTFARSLGKLKKAENAFQDALRIRRQLYGHDHVSVASVLQELGDLMEDIGEYDSTIKLYLEALEIRQKHLGDGPLVAETLYRFGVGLQNKGAYEKSLQVLDECLDIWCSYSNESKEVGDALNRIGFAQGKIGELEEAKNSLWEALSIRKKYGDKDKIFETLKNIGNVHREEEEYDLALECFDECLHIRREENDEDDDKVAEILIEIGHVFTDLENGDEALQTFNEALDVRIRLFGDSDDKVAAVLQLIGEIEFRAGVLDEALNHLLEFVSIRQANGTKRDENYVNVLFIVGNIHKMQENDGAAQTCWKEAYKIFKELGMAENNPQIAEVMRSLVPDADEDEEDENQWKRTKNMLSRLTEKVKDAVGEQKLGLSRKKKNRGHQL